MENPININADFLKTSSPELQSWFKYSENQHTTKLYMKLKSQDGKPMLYAPDAKDRGILNNSNHADILITEPDNVYANTFNFSVGGIEIKDFPNAPKDPTRLIVSIEDVAGFTGVKNLLKIPYRNLFDNMEFTRWFTLGSNVFEIAQKKYRSNPDLLPNLAVVHLASFIWGSIGYENYFKGQLQFVTSGKLRDLAKRVYPNRENSQLPFGNALS